MGLPSGLGFDILTDSEIRLDAFLFGESQSRVLVTVSEDDEDEFLKIASKSDLPFLMLGHVTRGKMVVDDEHYGFIEEAREIYDFAIAREMD